MENTMQTIDLKKFKTLFPGSVDAELGDDFFIAGFNLDSDTPVIRFPCRVDGYVAFFCEKGDLDIDINLQTFPVGPNTLIINVPGNIFRISRYASTGLMLYVVAISKDFFSSVNVDFKKLFNESMSLLSNPCIVLHQDEVLMLDEYLKMGSDIISSRFSNRKEMLGSIICSVSYFFSSIWTKHLSDAIKENSIKGKSNRASAVFNEFLKLVTEFHMQERGVSFYADKLFLTPKYLSRIVKEVSGISAPEWIHSFVILEAKNMLKYSDLTIAEIVYRLHFPSPSVFCKFFKLHTGMTPTNYRRI